MEWAIGVPGTVGGAIVGNAGAHGGGYRRVTCIWRKLLRRGHVPEYWTNRQLQFGYRKSALKHMRHMNGRWC